MNDFPPRLVSHIFFSQSFVHTEYGFLLYQSTIFCTEKNFLLNESILSSGALYLSIYELRMIFVTTDAFHDNYFIENRISCL